MGISIRNIEKRFGEFVAVNNVSFDVLKGELVALLGPSGCGKSTILRIIAGLEQPDAGSVYLNGKNVNTLSASDRRVGFVFQHYALFKHMTVADNIGFALTIQKKSRQQIAERVHRLIDLVRLQGYEKHYPAQLSGGQRQRVALARALAAEPQILLLDEPFGALDLKVRESLVAWLREMHDKLNVTSIFVTHDQNEAMEISDKIIVINKGSVEQIGSARDVYEHPDNKFVASFIGNVNIIDAVIEHQAIFVKGTCYSVGDDYERAGSAGDVILLVRPEDIVIRDEQTASHCLSALIKTLRYKGSFTEIDLAVDGFMLTAVDFEKNTWRNNQRVHITFKKYKIFKTDVTHQAIRQQLEQLGYIE